MRNDTEHGAELDNDDSSEHSIFIEELSESTFIEIMALLYLKLQAKLFVSGSTVNAIIQEISQAHALSSSHMKGMLKTYLEKENMSALVINEILGEVDINDYFKMAHSSDGPLR